MGRWHDAGWCIWLCLVYWLFNVQGPGKYVFENGTEQHGEYISVQVTEEDGEDEVVTTVPTWKAYKVKAIL